MRIANGVKMLELHAEGFGGKAVLNPTLIWDDENVILIDTGMPGQLKDIRAAMDEAGVPFEKLTAVILTHQDIDHIGSIQEILQEAKGRIQVYAHELDQPYIEGELPLIKTNPNAMEKMLASLPEEVRKEALASFENPPKAKVDTTLEDGQELPVCGGVQVIFTPGHTPGHISLYLKESKTLIAADAFFIWEGKLHGPVTQTTLDLEEAYKSIEKLLDLDIESVICYHGGFTNDNVKEQLQGMVAK